MVAEGFFGGILLFFKHLYDNMFDYEGGALWMFGRYLGF